MYYGERLNGYTHLVGALMASAAACVLMALAAMKGDPVRLASFAVYGTTLVSLYIISTLYHGTRGRTKAVFRKLDHIAIYLVIAGTYTPFTLVTLSGTPGWTLFAVVWGLAVVGIAQEIWIARGMRLTSLAIYLMMGWAAMIAAGPLLEALDWHGFAWLIAGGVVYTIGVIFYLYDERHPHWHGIWHLCVMAGSAVHYAAIVQFVA